MRKLITLFALIAILAATFGSSANPAAAAGCPTLAGVSTEMAFNGNCHYEFDQPVTVTITGKADLFDTDTGVVRYSVSGTFPTNSMTLKRGANAVVAGETAPAQQAPAQQPTQPAPAQQSSQGLPPSFCFPPLADSEQFLPDGDAAYAAQLLLGDSNKTGLLSRPEPDRLPGAWILRSPGQTCIFVPWFAEVDFNVGSGNQTVVGPTFLTIVDQATIRFNTDLGPRRPGTPTGGACFDIDQSNLFAPRTGDKVQAAKVFVGNVNRAGDFVWPEPERVPNAIVFRTTEPTTCLLNPGWVEIEYNVGQGVQVSNLPGFVTVAGQATIRINTGIAPTRPIVRLFTPLLRNAA